MQRESLRLGSPRTPRLALAAALVLAAGALPARADTDPLVLSYDKDHYFPTEVFFLSLTGAPGDFPILLMDTAPGPTFVPGVGTLDLGLSAGLMIIFLPPQPADGQTLLQCDVNCDSPLLGIPVYTQAVTIDPFTFEICLSNSDVLVTEDTFGVCQSQGCTPGYWKNHPETWPATGYLPGEDFDTVFGVDVFSPDLTLIEAASPPIPAPIQPQTFASHAVAALLNAAHSGSSFGLTPAEVIQMVQDAVANGTFEETKDVFEVLNESGCPF